jgi:hypothetical protein
VAIVAVQKRQTLIAREAEIRQEDDDAQRSNTAARAIIEKKIIELAEQLRTNAYPEMQRYNAARDKVRELDFAFGEIDSTKHLVPLLFPEMPVGTKRHGSENLPHDILAAITRLGLNLNDYAQTTFLH